MHFYLSDDLVQSTAGDKRKHPDGCPRNGEGQPEGSETFEMDNLKVQSDKEASTSFADSLRRLSQTSTDILNRSAELAEQREAEAAAAAATAAKAADSDVATDARKAAGQAALDRSAAAKVLSAAPAVSNVATSLLALQQQQQQQQQQNTVIDMPNQDEKKRNNLVDKRRIFIVLFLNF
jgi:hypothetical protein